MRNDIISWVATALFGLTFLGLLVLAGHTYFKEQSPQSVDARLDSVVRVVAYVGDSAAVGSGVFIRDDGLILTAAHVVRDTETVLVEKRDGEVYGTDVLWIGAQGLDLALLKVEDDAEFTSVPVNCAGAVAGDDVSIVGHPLGEYGWSLVKGNVSGEHNGLLQVAAELLPGNSGGPVYDEDGAVVGIAASAVGLSAFSLSEIGLAVHARDICNALGRDT